MTDTVIDSIFEVWANVNNYLYPVYSNTQRILFHIFVIEMLLLYIALMVTIRKR